MELAPYSTYINSVTPRKSIINLGTTYLNTSNEIK